MLSHSLSQRPVISVKGADALSVVSLAKMSTVLFDDIVSARSLMKIMKSSGTRKEP